MFFLAAFFSIVVQGFLYRKGGFGSRVLFWSTIGVGIVFLPLSFLFALISAGTSCGEGTIVIGRGVMYFFLAALGLQVVLILSTDSGESVKLQIHDQGESKDLPR
jgi:hypothetical protein